MGIDQAREHEALACIDLFVRPKTAAHVGGLADVDDAVILNRDADICKNPAFGIHGDKPACISNQYTTHGPPYCCSVQERYSILAPSSPIDRTRFYFGGS
jgi:hypothetical protein